MVAQQLGEGEWSYHREPEKAQAYLAYILSPLYALLPASGRPIDPDLMAVVAAWPVLPEAVRQRIVAMVKAAAGRR